MTMPTPMSGESPSDLHDDPGTEDSRPDRALPSPSPEPSRRVLLVEPAAADRSRLRDVLTAGGLEVHACDDLAAADLAAAIVQPNLILARWDLPSSSGPDPVRRLLEQAALPAWVPVILHGGRATAQERAAAFDLGAFDVLATLPGDAELLARLRAALRVRGLMHRLERRAYRDSLTGLINRGALEDQLRRLWESSRRHGTSLSILIVDLDRFKEINDAHGHAAGDEALRRTAAVLANSVRLSDVVARYAGDEFVIVAPACLPESAVALAVRFREGLAAPADATAGTPLAVPITLSVGIAGTRGPAPERLDDLLHQADQALYLAKRSGRDTVALYDPSRGGPTLADP
jgi:two-component system, cell cycle response regulator